MKKNILLIFVNSILVHYTNGQPAIAWDMPYRYTSQQFDYGREVKVDAAGNVYVGGHSLINQSQEGIITILKYDSQGNLVWEFHSSSMNILEDMLIDGEGNTYYTGARWSDSTAEWDFLTGKIDNNGAEIWSALYDGNGIGSGWDYAWGMSLDGSGNVYTTGHSQGTFNGYDFLTVKYNSSGIEQWVARYENPLNGGLQSNYDNDVFEVETDLTGNVYVSGYTFNGTNHEITLLKYNSAGTLLWTKNFDTKTKWPTTYINKNYMKLDNNANIYLLGSIADSATGADLLLLKYDSSGTLSWSRKWNSPLNDSDYASGGFYDDEALMIDKNSDVIISGVSSDRTTLFKENILTVKYDGAGNILWSDVYNGPGNDEDWPYGLALDKNNNVYVCGSTAMSSAIGDLDYVTFRLNGTTGLHEWDETYDGVAAFYDEAHAIFVDSSDNVYVTGWNAINNDPFDLHGEMMTIKYIQGTTGIKTLLANSAINIFPVPVNQQVTISFNDNSIKELSIFDNTGKLIINKTVSGNKTLIETTTFPEGIYSVRIDNASSRFIVAH